MIDFEFNEDDYKYICSIRFINEFTRFNKFLKKEILINHIIKYGYFKFEIYDNERVAFDYYFKLHFDSKFFRCYKTDYVTSILKTNIEIKITID